MAIRTIYLTVRLDLSNPDVNEITDDDVEEIVSEVDYEFRNYAIPFLSNVQLMDGSVTSYMHVGQHGAAYYKQVIDSTTPASEGDYSALLEELETIGYDNLRIVKRK